MAPATTSPPPATHGEKFDLHSRLLVERSPEKYGSRAVSLVNLPRDAVFAPITGTTAATKAYTSVQTGPNSHIELNSDLVFCNHSCDPSLVFDMHKSEVRVVPHRDLKVGEALTFFYPTTEWYMAQPFDCNCGTQDCRGTIKGAKEMDENVLSKYVLNAHIEKMLAERKAGGEGGSGN